MFCSKAHDTLEEENPPQPVSCDNIELLKEILDDLVVLSMKNNHAKDLYAILKDPHFKVNRVLF